MATEFPLITQMVDRALRWSEAESVTVACFFNEMY